MRDKYSALSYAAKYLNSEKGVIVMSECCSAVSKEAQAVIDDVKKLLCESGYSDFTHCNEWVWGDLVCNIELNYRFIPQVFVKYILRKTREVGYYSTYEPASSTFHILLTNHRHRIPIPGTQAYKGFVNQENELIKSLKETAMFDKKFIFDSFVSILNQEGYHDISIEHECGKPYKMIVHDTYVRKVVIDKLYERAKKLGVSLILESPNTFIISLWAKYDDIFNNLPKIKNVIFNPPATIVFWANGDKTVVKCGENDIFDPEKGFFICITKKALGNQGNYYETIKKWLPEPKVEDKVGSGRKKDKEKFIPVVSAAEKLGVSASTVRKWYAKGKLRGTTLANGRIYISLDNPELSKYK